MRNQAQSSLIPPRNSAGDQSFSLFLYLSIGGLSATAFSAFWFYVVYPYYGLGTGFPVTVVLLESALLGLIAGTFVFLLARRADRVAFQEGETLRWLVESTSVGIWILDARSRTVWSNEAMHQILGMKPDPGEGGLSFFTPESRERARRELASRPAGVSSTYQADMMQPDGGLRTILVSGTPIQTAEGQFLGSFGVFRDITDQLLAQEEATEEARLSTVVATVARLNHKINNSLMVIRGQADVQLRHDPDGPGSDMYRRIVEQVDSISGELRILSQLKQVETESYLGDRAMLRVPEEPEADSG
jgi:PAS domain S-box-containing protein